MSFILDALKKSESERQRKGAPGIADLPLGSRSTGGSRWMWIIGSLLVINLAVLIVLASRPDTPEANPAPSADLAPVESSKPAQRATPTFSEIVAEVKRDSPPATVAPEIKDPEPVVRVEAPPAATTGSARVVDGPPSFSELRADGSLNVQELHLDIHVFSTTPSDRFVFINMNRYREGATLEEGPRVTEITPEGVILEYTGMRFLLPRE
jgi:general secretion pathway protein B